MLLYGWQLLNVSKNIQNKIAFVWCNLVLKINGKILKSVVKNKLPMWTTALSYYHYAVVVVVVIVVSAAKKKTFHLCLTSKKFA